MDRQTRSKGTVDKIQHYCGMHNKYFPCKTCKDNKPINAAISSYNNSSNENVDIDGVKDILKELLK